MEPWAGERGRLNDGRCGWTIAAYVPARGTIALIIGVMRAEATGLGGLGMGFSQAARSGAARARARMSLGMMASGWGHSDRLRRMAAHGQKRGGKAWTSSAAE